MVVGINSAAALRASGIGFAIPASVTIPTVQSLEKLGRVFHSFLGLHVVADFDFSPTGLLKVDSVVAGSPADVAGIRPNDLLLQINGKSSINSVQALLDLLDNTPVGHSIHFNILRKSTDPSSDSSTSLRISVITVDLQDFVLQQMRSAAPPIKKNDYPIIAGGIVPPSPEDNNKIEDDGIVHDHDDDTSVSQDDDDDEIIIDR